MWRLAQDRLSKGGLRQVVGGERLFALKQGGRAMKEQNLAIDTFVPALRTLASVLDKGAAHAREKGTDPQALLQERLAPDMFPLSSQIQIACYHAKDGSARATGQEPPKIDVKELTFDEHKALITKTGDAFQAIGASE